MLLLSSENSSSEKLNWVEKQFRMKELGTNVKKETLAGITTFCFHGIFGFVNPSVLGASGMDKGAAFTATALSAILGCLLMAFLANYPIAIALGLGDNAFFNYSVVLAMGIKWQTAPGTWLRLLLRF